MGTDPDATKELVQALDKETSFRTGILSTLLTFVKDPAMEADLKALIITGSLDVVGISFVVTFGILHVIADLLLKREPPLLWYATIVCILLALLMALAIPLVTKASAKEGALRLSDSLNKISRARARG